MQQLASNRDPNKILGKLTRVVKEKILVITSNLGLLKSADNHN